MHSTLRCFQFDFQSCPRARVHENSHEIPRIRPTAQKNKGSCFSNDLERLLSGLRLDNLNRHATRNMFSVPTNISWCLHLNTAPLGSIKDDVAAQVAVHGRRRPDVDRFVRESYLVRVDRVAFAINDANKTDSHEAEFSRLLCRMPHKTNKRSPQTRRR